MTALVLVPLVVLDPSLDRSLVPKHQAALVPAEMGPAAYSGKGLGLAQSRSACGFDLGPVVAHE